MRARGAAARCAKSVAGNGSWAARLGESVGDGGGRARGVHRVESRDVPSRRTCRRRVVATDGARRGRRGVTHIARGFRNRRRENARGGETRADREGDGAKARWRVARREKRTPGAAKLLRSMTSTHDAAAAHSCLLARRRARVVHPTAIESQKNARSSIGTIRPSFLISWVSSREPSIPPFLFFREPTLGEKATTDEGKQRSAPGRTPDRTSLSAPRAERRRARTLLESVSDDRSPLARSRSRVRHLTSRSATADAPDLPPPDLVRHPHPHGVRWATTRSSRS